MQALWLNKVIRMSNGKCYICYTIVERPFVNNMATLYSQHVNETYTKSQKDHAVLCYPEV